MANIVITGDHKSDILYRSAVMGTMHAAKKTGSSVYTLTSPGAGGVEALVHEIGSFYGLTVRALLPISYLAADAMSRLSHPTIHDVVFIHNDPLGSSLAKRIASNSLVMDKTTFTVPSLHYAQSA